LAEQYDEDQFNAEIDAMFNADPELKAYMWSQYIPSFNDGDPCVWHASESENPLAYGDVPSSYVGYADDEEEFEGTNGELVTFKTTRDFAPTGDYGYVEQEDGTRRWEFIADEGQVESDFYKAVKAFEASLFGGHYESILRSYFGDNAAVVATADSFEVEYYDYGY
jgi:hypothetical protein